MSDAHANAQDHAQDHDGPHEGPIKTPKQLIWAVVASFVIPIIVIIMLTQFVAIGEKQAAGSDALQAEAVARRIQPIGAIEVKDVNDVASLKTGDQVYQAQCSACHATGAAGAPKLGDTAAWGPRNAQGFQTLLSSALKGKGNMGPQGGGDFSDFEIARAVVYLANQGGAKFEEPKAPAAAASAPQ
jgi:cytochrome c5